MKNTLTKVFCDSETSLQNRVNGRTYIEYDPTSNRINDGSGYIEPPYEDLDVVDRQGNRIGFVEYSFISTNETRDDLTR